MRFGFKFSALFLLLMATSYAQDITLKNGRKLSINTVTAKGNGFSGTITSAAGVENIAFTSKDIAHVTYPVMTELSDAKLQLANAKYDEALALTEVVIKKYLPIKSLPNSPYVQAVISQLDILGAMKKQSKSCDYVSDLSALDSADAEKIGEMVSIIDSKDIGKLKGIAKNSQDTFIQARAWLQAAQIEVDSGELLSAINDFLRVPVFFGAESDLSFRATMATSQALVGLKRSEDATKLLQFYLIDNPLTNYKDIVDKHLAQLAPPKKQ